MTVRLGPVKIEVRISRSFRPLFSSDKNHASYTSGKLEDMVWVGLSETHEITYSIHVNKSRLESSHTCTRRPFQNLCPLSTAIVLPNAHKILAIAKEYCLKCVRGVVGIEILSCSVGPFVAAGYLRGSIPYKKSSVMCRDDIWDFSLTSPI
jgi:hypothetical protein